MSLKKRVIIDERKYLFISNKKHELLNHAKNGARTCVVNWRPFQRKTIHNLRLRDPPKKMSLKKENVIGDL